VVKARNKLDGRTYAVKKIRLRASDNDAKIFREVNALARLSHRFIVRYYTTWIEISEGSDSPSPRTHSSLSLSGHTENTPRTSSRTTDVFQIDLNDLARSTTNNESFPGIYFGDASGFQGLNDHESDSENEIESPQATRSRLRTRIPASTLFIQMVGFIQFPLCYTCQSLCRNM
jgi:eukaryotic translation initiation factor 2-alpha kinase 4